VEKRPTHKVVAVDIDGVIIDSMQGTFNPDTYNPADIERFPTMKGCGRVLKRLWEAGYTIILYTSRTNTEWVHNMGNGSAEKIKEELTLQLKFRGLHFHFLSIFKPIADVYIDDRGLHFRDWTQVEKDLDVLGYFEDENTIN